MAIYIEMTSGRADESDKERALNAAEAVLANVSHAVAYGEYVAQWEALDSHEGMTGLALVWIAACEAADRALTEGWHNPNGASCSIGYA